MTLTSAPCDSPDLEDVDAVDDTGGEQQVEVRTRPVRVCLMTASELIALGLAAMLAPYGDRVELVTGGAPGDADVVLVDPPHSLVDRRYVTSLALHGHPCVIMFGRGGAGGPAMARTRSRWIAGYVSMELDAASLVDTIEGALRDGLPPLPQAEEPIQAPSHPFPVAGLSSREAQIVGLICQGRTNQEIAEELFLSINSVKTYIRSAYRKLGLERRVDVVAWGLQYGR